MLLEWIWSIALIFGGIIFVLAGVAFNVIAYRFSGKYFSVGGLQIVAGITLLVAAWRKRKHELAQLVAARESDPRVVEALKKRYSFDEWYKSITPA